MGFLDEGFEKEGFENRGGRGQGSGNNRRPKTHCLLTCQEDGGQTFVLGDWEWHYQIGEFCTEI